MSTFGPDDRGNLSGTPTPSAAPTPTPTPSPLGAPPPYTGGSTGTGSGFDFNRPTIISLLYLSSTVLGVTSIVGLVLGYVWKGEPHAEWEDSHYQYLINTFWIGLVGSVISIVLMFVLIGILTLIAVAVLVLVRCVMSLINAQKQMPMPNPGTLLV